MKKRNKFLIFILLVVILFSGAYFLNIKYDFYSKIKSYLSKDEVNVIEEYSSSEEIKEIVIPKLKIIDEDSDSRVVAVMINNHKSARPQSGLGDAFLNYEIIVEGGITRIMSLFKDKTTSRMGSVRSARHYFLDYALENDAIYVHIGESPQAKNDIINLGVDALNGLKNSSLYWRDTALKLSSEHTAFTSIDKINKLIDSKGYRKTSNEPLLLNYSSVNIDLSDIESSIKADSVYIEYSSYTNTSYEYDAVTGLYKRFMGGVSHKDYITGDQYTTKNIITYQVKNTTIDSKGRQGIDNIGDGEGYYISGGYAIPITWEKSTRSSKTIYKYLSGDVIDVNDGVTWIQIQPVNKKLEIK